MVDGVWSLDGEGALKDVNVLGMFEEELANTFLLMILWR